MILLFTRAEQCPGLPEGIVECFDVLVNILAEFIPLVTAGFFYLLIFF